MTLTELMVVLALIAILVAMGKVGYDAVAARFNERAAAAGAESVISAQTSFARVYGTYTPYPGDLKIQGAAVSVVAAPAKASGEVSIAVGSGGTLALSYLNDAGGCTGVQVNALGAGAVRTSVSFPSGALCDARAALPDGEYPLNAESAAW